MHLRVITVLLVAGSIGWSQQADLRQAQGLLGQKQPAAAEKVLAGVVKTYPQHIGAWYLLGFACHQQGKHDEALTAYAKAIGHPRLGSVAHYNSACIHALAKRTDNALDELERAVAAGFADWGLMRTDADLVSLRKHERFLALIPRFLEGKEAFVEDVRVLHEWRGESAQDQFGWVARPVGDLDGDGATDFATSAPTKSTGGPGAGRVYAYSSKSGKLLWQRDGAVRAGLGTSIARAGDVNADGTPDVIVGAPGIGSAYVFSGKDGTTLSTLQSGEPGDGFGVKVCGLGDLDRDGHADLLVGAWNSNGAAKRAGRAYAFSGKTGLAKFTLDGATAGARFGSAADAWSEAGKGLLIVGAMKGGAGAIGRARVFRLDGFAATPAFTIEGEAGGSHLGQYFVSVVGDVDGDGTPDVYASDFGHASGTGRVYVHSGKTGKRLHTLSGGHPGAGFGTSSASAGDVNGDGFADLAIGAWRHGSGAKSGGRCVVHSGKDASVLATFTSKQAGDTLGFDACGIGDVNGDGKIDFLLTSAWSAINGSKSGRVWIVAGE